MQGLHSHKKYESSTNHESKKDAQVWIVISLPRKPDHNHLKCHNLMIHLGLEIPDLHQAKGKLLTKNLVNLTRKQDGIR